MRRDSGYTVRDVGSLNRTYVNRERIEEPGLSSGDEVQEAWANVGARFVLDSEVTRAGRHPESDIFLDDITVSRRHAEFVRRDSGYMVRDVGSLNGPM